MSLQANGMNGLAVKLTQHHPTSYPYKLRYSAEDTLRLRQAAVVNGKVITPWRVVIIGADLNTMVSNDLVHNLCPPPDRSLFPDGIKTSWIKPGRDCLWRRQVSINVWKCRFGNCVVAVPYPVEAYPEGNQRHLSAESGLYCRIIQRECLECGQQASKLSIARQGFQVTGIRWHFVI